MNLCCVLPCLILAVFVQLKPTHAQGPPRLSIPGAVLVNQPRIQYRQRIQLPQNPQPRARRPPPQFNEVPSPPIRPVVEDVEEQNPQSLANFDDELSRLGLSALQSAVRQPAPQAEEEPETERPIQFRPERPVPVLRQDVRDGPRDQPPPPPPPPVRQLPLFRDAIPPKPTHRQELNFVRGEQREEGQAPPRQQISRQSAARQNVVQAPPQQVRQPARAPPRPAPQYDDEDTPHNRRKKPVVQILRKYRTDNEDGSITWGYENEDGTFKDETLGTDCVIRGKYGYVDPDGVRREYSYETGNKCDQLQEPEPEELLLQGKQPAPQARKPQLRPLPAQY